MAPPLSINTHAETKPQRALQTLVHAAIARLPWVVLGLSLAGTLAAWYLTRVSVLETAKVRFDAAVNDSTAAIESRMRAYEQVLRGGAALVGARGVVDRSTWGRYVEDLRIETAYPGIQAIGYAQSVDPARKGIFVQSIRADGNPTFDIWPEGERAIYAPIRHIAPFAGANRKVLGYDMFSEPVRRAALEQARDSGNATLSGKVVLVQDTETTRKQAGTLLYLPVYRNGLPHATPSERRVALQGYVYGAFRMSDLMAKTLANDQFDKIDIEIFDGPEASPTNLLFDGDAVLHAFVKDFPAAFVVGRHVNIAGRPWTLNFTADPDFTTEYGSELSRFALIGGGIMSLLLFGAAWMLQQSQRASETRAETMASAYGESEERLNRIISSATDAIITIDEKQNIMMFNPAAETMFRCNASDAVGTALERFIPERFRIGHHRHIETFGNTGTTSRTMGRELPLHGLRADGDEFPIDASISQLDHDGTKFFTVILRDITRRKAAEDALLASNLKLRELSIYVESAREAERIRIAREIHDDIAATLTAVKMDLVAMTSQAKSDIAALEERLPHSIKLMDAAVSTTRRIINDLRPSILDNLGVWAAIEWQTGETAQRAGIAHRLEIKDELLSLELPAARTTALFRIVQEALANVWRHAQAKLVTVRAYRQSDFVVVEIEDDGKGIMEIDQIKQGHWGIMGMFERARSQGGHLALNRTQRGGTIVEIRMPIV
jgi:two-component system, NarL family, sensor histidine kinase UhpB